MKLFVACAALFTLAACNSEEAAAPAPTPAPTQAAAPAAPSMPPPTAEDFAAAYAEACPDAQQVSTSLCKSNGFGETGFACDYGLGDDEYRRHKAQLEPAEGKWALAESENACVADGAA